MKIKNWLIIVFISVMTPSCAITSTLPNTTVPILIPTETALPSRTPMPSPTFTPTSTLTPTSTPIPCVASTESEYIISGGIHSDDGIFVDDILRVFINETLITEISQGGRCCQPATPIHFIANSGDTLRVQAQDANACYSVETLWLQKSDGSCLTLLTNEIFGPNCDSEIPRQIFFDQTFVLP